ncbi:hypothetical protein AB0C81_29020 [Streptomyces roseoverticillatus]|uniref:hypothetical protein n=1 Tax=Streptomyces roseoverticillatus TaxID=66429 RepID=UPI0033E23C5D
MSARHAREAIDTSHPARAFLALAALAVGLPVAVVHPQSGTSQPSVPSPVSAADDAPGGTEWQATVHVAGDGHA